MRSRERILVIDIESTCWATPEEQGNQISEIIEIGLCGIIQNTRQIYSNDALVIKPTRSTVSEFCTDLTGWTQEKLNNGISYTDAVGVLKKEYDSKNQIMASWGKYDDKMFYAMSELHRCAYPFNNDHLNVKALFGAKFGYVCSVEDALKALGMEFHGRPHSGIDDAFNIATILTRLL